MRKRILAAGLLAAALAAALTLSGCSAETQKESSIQDTGSEQDEAATDPALPSENAESDAAEGATGGTTEAPGETASDNSPSASADGAADEVQTETESVTDPDFSGIPSCVPGDTFTFGHYEQDNDTENGAEAIEWTVLDTNGDMALLLSRYGLDAQAYNDSNEAVTWENCTLRRWLSETFYATAFSDAERQVIVPATNVNPDNAHWGTSGGNDTEDTIFLLSLDEAEKYFSDRNENLWTQATPYAVQQGAFVADNGYSPWWLRSPGDHNEGGFCAAYVDYPPVGVNLGGYDATRSSRVIRPALWVGMTLQ
jgi:hypothetical protein